MLQLITSAVPSVQRVPLHGGVPCALWGRVSWSLHSAARWAKIGVKTFSALERKTNSQASANCSSHFGRAVAQGDGVTAAGPWEHPRGERPAPCARRRRERAPAPGAGLAPRLLPGAGFATLRGHMHTRHVALTLFSSGCCERLKNVHFRVFIFWEPD